MKKYIFILLFVIASSAYGQVPKGWRIPTQADIKGQWRKDHWDKECQKAKDLSKKSADDAVEYTGNSVIDKIATSKPQEVEFWKPETFPVHVATGDYNGDGIVDEARILISTTRPLKIGFFAFLKTRNGSGRAILLESYKMVDMSVSPPQDHFISTQPPVEKLATWCSSIPEDCAPGAPKFLTLKRDSVMFGEFEAWAILAYWSAADDKFKLVTISD